MRIIITTRAELRTLDDGQKMLAGNEILISFYSGSKHISLRINNNPKTELGNVCIQNVRMLFRYI